MLRSMRGTSTYTRRGAARVLERESGKRQRKLLAETEKQQRMLVEELRALGATPASGSSSALWGITWKEAELLVWDWMRRNGYPDAQLTPAGADGGVDVSAKGAAAQVKHHAKPVGLSYVQRLAGVANAEGKAALFFSVSGYTSAARRWAAANNVECFVYPPIQAAPSVKP